MAPLHRNLVSLRPQPARADRPKLSPARGALLLATSLFWSVEAGAQDDAVKACAEAYEQAQVTRNSGRLKESEEQLRVCVRDMCPDFVKADCGQWLSDVRREMPSVILMVTDGGGHELKDVRVSVDGVPLAQGLDGRALEINPGPHEITFEREGARRSERVSIRQGEKNRVIKIELTTQADTDADGIIDTQDRCPDEVGDQNNGGCPSSQTPLSPVVRSEGLSGLKVGAIVAGGVGLLGLGTFAVAGTMSRINADEAVTKCGEEGNRCAKEVVDEYKDKEATYNPIANIGVVVGGAGLVTAVVLFALSLEDDGQAQESQVGGVRFSVAPTRGGAWLGAGTRF